MTKEIKTEEIEKIHKSVFLAEAVDYLNIEKGKIYVDCTVGLGGHSEKILEKLSGNGLLIGFEQDVHAFNLAKQRLERFNNFKLFNTNFIEIKNVLQSLNIQKVNGGILADFGISSLQIDSPERGFSFQQDGPLDMRMDSSQELSADYVINCFKEKDLADIIYKFGEERNSRKIAKSIISRRPLKSTKELSNAILRCYPKSMRFKVHPATKTFQALRIFVNSELDNIEKFLCFTTELLEPHARLSIISFHSLEDRLVKLHLKNKSHFRPLTKKPTMVSLNELKANPRSRSAKLRVAERI